VVSGEGDEKNKNSVLDFELRPPKMWEEEEKVVKEEHSDF
jgi:hypothetical protein